MIQSELQLLSKESWLTHLGPWSIEEGGFFKAAPQKTTIWSVDDYFWSAPITFIIDRTPMITKINPIKLNPRSMVAVARG